MQSDKEFRKSAILTLTNGKTVPACLALAEWEVLESDLRSNPDQAHLTIGFIQGTVDTEELPSDLKESLHGKAFEVLKELVLCSVGYKQAATKLDRPFKATPENQSVLERLEQLKRKGFQRMIDERRPPWGTNSCHSMN